MLWWDTKLKFQAWICSSVHYTCWHMVECPHYFNIGPYKHQDSPRNVCINISTHLTASCGSNNLSRKLWVLPGTVGNAEEEKTACFRSRQEILSISWLHMLQVRGKIVVSPGKTVDVITVYQITEHISHSHPVNPPWDQIYINAIAKCLK